MGGGGKGGEITMSPLVQCFWSASSRGDEVNPHQHPSMDDVILADIAVHTCGDVA